MTKQPKKKVVNQFFVPHNVLEEHKFLSLPLSAQMLYIHLCRLQNRLGKKFYRSISTLSHETGINQKTIKQAKAKLKDAQYIDITRDYYLHNGFRSADRFSLNGYKYLDNPKG
jgi:hypothetical protein